MSQVVLHMDSDVESEISYAFVVYALDEKAMSNLLFVCINVEMNLSRKLCYFSGIALLQTKKEEKNRNERTFRQAVRFGLFSLSFNSKQMHGIY